MATVAEAIQVPVVASDLQEAWERGKKMARDRFGAETRDWDEVLMGISEMLKARGASNAEYMDIGDLWHYPTAGYTHPGDSVEKVIRDLEGGLTTPGGREMRPGFHDPFDTGRNWWRLDRARKAALDRESLEFEAKNGLDIAIKEEHPNLRRGTKAWKELWEKHWPGALRYYKKQAEENRDREVADLRRWWDGEGKKEVDKELHGAEWNLKKIAHVEALKPDSAAAAKARAAPEDFVRRAREYIAYHESEFDRIAKLEVGRGREVGEDVRPRISRRMRRRRGQGKGWHRQPRRHAKAARLGHSRRRRQRRRRT